VQAVAERSSAPLPHPAVRVKVRRKKVVT